MQDGIYTIICHKTLQYYQVKQDVVFYADRSGKKFHWQITVVDPARCADFKLYENQAASAEEIYKLQSEVIAESLAKSWAKSPQAVIAKEKLQVVEKLEFPKIPYDFSDVILACFFFALIITNYINPMNQTIFLSLLCGMAGFSLGRK